MWDYKLVKKRGAKKLLSLGNGFPGFRESFSVAYYGDGTKTNNETSKMTGSGLTKKCFEARRTVSASRQAIPLIQLLLFHFSLCFLQ